MVAFFDLRRYLQKFATKISDTPLEPPFTRNYIPLAPSTSLQEDTYAQIKLENNTEVSLTNLSDYVLFEIPETVQHGYWASAVLSIPDSVDKRW